MGDTCNQCHTGFFGENCDPCPRNPKDHFVCGQGGVCDDGRDGTGKCVCTSPHHDPHAFCEIHHDDHHDENEGEQAFGFTILLLVAFLTTFMLYIFHKMPSLQIVPEAVTCILVGILIGIFFKIIYNFFISLSFYIYTNRCFYILEWLICWLGLCIRLLVYPL